MARRASRVQDALPQDKRTLIEFLFWLWNGVPAMPATRARTNPSRWVRRESRGEGVYAAFLAPSATPQNISIAVSLLRNPNGQFSIDPFNCAQHLGEFSLQVTSVAETLDKDASPIGTVRLIQRYAEARRGRERLSMNLHPQSIRKSHCGFEETTPRRLHGRIRGLKTCP
jgi:hypothetical protein